MAIGLYNASINNPAERKTKSYGLAKEFFKRFVEKHGAVDCSVLLGYDATDMEYVNNLPEESRPKSVCRKYVKSAVLILSEILEEDRETP